jgi:hypothetical protein
MGEGTNIGGKVLRGSAERVGRSQGTSRVGPDHTRSHPSCGGYEGAIESRSYTQHLCADARCGQVGQGA